jgi:hypothetical protein
MKTICLIIFVSVVLMSFSVQADDVSRTEYQNEIQDLLNQYGEDFDDCFPKLSSDFPSLPDDFKELDNRINELELDTWHHRKIPYFNTEIDEIFFTMKTGMSYFAIRVAYLYNTEESEYIIYAVHFYETIEGINSELWHMETLPYGVTDDSIEALRACVGTPGFMLISLIIALFIIVVGKKYYIKK